MPVISPTPGRVVWYHPSASSADCNFVPAGVGIPLAAHIACVLSDTRVNLMVIDAHGAPHSRTSVLLVQEGCPAPNDGNYCEWMPYQKGQAAKTEALAHEVKQYANGTVAAGPAPLPDHPPA
jgi:hypothetical protein